MSSWHSYPKVYALGHSALTVLFEGPVVVQEKVDGSQFSFGFVDGDIHIRSKGQDIFPRGVPAMFQGAVDTVIRLYEADLLREGWTYRGEVLAKPRHNILAYDRVPTGNIILFDINDAEESYLSFTAVRDEAARLGLQVVPTYDVVNGPYSAEDVLAKVHDTVSVLGGAKIEGLVFKNYTRFGIDGKVLMGKYVSEAFKEVHEGEWRKANPTTNDQVQAIIEKYRTPARWAKAVQHLRESSLIQDDPRDIGPLLKEVHDDLQAECAEEIREMLFKHFWPKVARGVAAGFPEWYKKRLLALQFEEVAE